MYQYVSVCISIYQYVNWSGALYSKQGQTLLKLPHIPFVWANLLTSTPYDVHAWGIMFSHWWINYKDIGLMGVITSKHVVYELLIALKKGLQAKTYLMSHTMSICL